MLAVRYVLERDITERYLLSVYAFSISAKVGITAEAVVVLVPELVAVAGTTVD
ncbi:MAG: hypothetical protein WAW59_00945 [Patescibacteria group bacterium]